MKYVAGRHNHYHIQTFLDLHLSDASQKQKVQNHLNGSKFKV